MNLLIIGDDPKFIGGVTNYTRPLAQKLAASGVNVHYLFNSSRNQKYDFGPMRIEEFDQDGVKYHWLMNGRGMVYNYDDLGLDSGTWFDELFTKLVSDHNIDVIHINEIFGFSSNLIHIAKSRGIKVAVTVHEYWWLCPHRVMVDHDRKVCEGPTDMKKCVHCVSQRAQGYKPAVKRFQYRLRNAFPSVYTPIVSKIKGMKKNYYKLVELNTSETSNIIATDKSLERQLENRLSALIGALNACDRVICVSSDVKNILTRFGVKRSVCTVDHIGSEIAERDWELRTDWKPRERLSFGFIGGITYYKGVHLIVQAYMLLPENLKARATIDIYGGGDQGYVQSMKNLLERGAKIDMENIRFHGRYTPDQLPAIGESIDVSILPSMCADTAPQTIFESFSSGLPIIAPDIGGFSDFIKHDVNGLIFNYGNPQSLADAMAKLIEHPELVSAMCTQIEPSKAMSAHVQDMKNVYQEMSAA